MLWSNPYLICDILKLLQASCWNAGKTIDLFLFWDYILRNKDNKKHTLKESLKHLNLAIIGISRIDFFIVFFLL